MNILVGCEFSGVVRQAFRNKGYEAYSLDIMPTEDNSPYHFQCELLDFMRQCEHGAYPVKWDMGIFFPPCKYLCVSGARWFKDRQKEQEQALDFVRSIMSLPIDKIAIENPIGVISTNIRKPDQIIQPWQFGHGETKSTCLWLKNLPLLKPTNIVEGRQPKIHYMSPSPNRSRDRSRTYTGIAQAMAEQWS